MEDVWVDGIILGDSSININISNAPNFSDTQMLIKIKFYWQLM